MRVIFLPVLAAAVCSAVYAHPPDTVHDGYVGGEVRRIRSYRTDSPPKIDGVLDDSCWSFANPTTTLYNERSFEPCTQQTIVRAAYDITHLYFAFECLEEDMEGLRALERRDDRRQMFRDDSVTVKLDTFHDHRTCYSFMTNAAGARYDTREGAAGRSREAGWNCEWTVGSSRADDRWFVEMAIPLDELLFDRTDGQTWGVNFMRDQIGLQEEGYWSLHNDDFNDPRRFGHLEGLDLADAVPTSRFRFEPYVSAMFESNGDEDFEANVGIDVTYKLTSDLTSAFTVNPDFSQVETDADDIMLRDVERFLPERRPYFKEGLELFDTPIPNLFYSRRIFDIDYGGKVSGKVGPYSLAVLDIEGQISRDGDNLSGNFAAVRVLRDVGQNASIGVLATNSDRDGGRNHLLAVDTQWKLPGTVDIKGQFATSGRNGHDSMDLSGEEEADEVTIDGTQDAFLTSLRWGQQPLWVSITYKDIGEYFRPDLSYVSRQDVKGPSMSVRYNDDTEGKWYERLEGDFLAVLYENHEDRTVLRDYSAQGEVTLPNGLGFGLWGDKDFHDPYDNHRVGASIEFNALDRWRSLEFGAGTGEFNEKRYHLVNVEKRFVLNHKLTAELEGEFRREYRDGDEDEAKYEDNVWLARTVANYSFSDDAWLKGGVQFSDQRTHNINLIFGWELYECIDWYLVYNDVRTDDEPQMRALFTKVVYTF